MKVIERQAIVTWHTLEEKRPPEDDIVLVTISGTNRDHCFALASYTDDEGWVLWSDDLEEFTVHAWCDLEPYKGGGNEKHIGRS